MEVHKSSISRHERNLLKRRSGPPPEPYYIPRGKAIYAKCICTIARGAIKQCVPEGSISLNNLLDEKSLDKITESARIRLSKRFVTFGSASAGVLVVFIIVQLIKLIIDAIIYGYALHSIYGCGIHLLGTIWSSASHLFLSKSIKTGQGD